MRAAGGLLFFAALCGAQIAGFQGTWVLHYHGLNVMKLTLEMKDGVATGALVRPEKFSVDQDGDVTELSGAPVTVTVQKVAAKADRLELTIDGDPFVMTLSGHDRATLVLEGMRPWKMDRVADGRAATLASSLPDPHYAADIRALREQLRAMVKEDQDARMAFDEARVEAADKKNRAEVLNIFEQRGWVTISLAGKDVAHDYWLLVQHQTPEIQRRLLPALEKAAKAGDASMSDYAYLYDRVQMGLGKPQHWGSQTKCVDGKPVLYAVDDPAGLDARRHELYLPPIEEYLKMDYLSKACASPGK